MNLPVPRGTTFIESIKKPEQVTCGLNFIVIMRMICNFDNNAITTNPPWSKFRMCQQMYHRAVRIPPKDLDNLGRTIIANFFVPRFAQAAFEKKGQEALAKGKSKSKGKGRALPLPEPVLPYDGDPYSA